MKKNKRIISYILASTMVATASLPIVASTYALASERTEVTQVEDSNDEGKSLQTKSIPAQDNQSQTIREVSTFDELKKAIADKSVEEIVIKENIEFTEQLKFTHSVKIRGEGENITLTAKAKQGEDEGLKEGEYIFHNYSVVDNLTIEISKLTFDGKENNTFMYLVGKDSTNITFNNVNINNCNSGASLGDESLGTKFQVGASVNINRAEKVNMVDTNFNKNKVGRAVILANSSIVIDNCKFNENGGPENLHGGAISITYTTDVNKTMEINDSEFINNSTLEGGGAIESGFTGEVKIINSKFIDNTADYGGVYHGAHGKKLTIDSCTFENNEASSNKGGALDLSDRLGETYVKNSTFKNNKSKLNGGAISVSRNNKDATTDYNNLADYEKLDLDNVTFEGNKSELGIFYIDKKKCPEIYKTHGKKIRNTISLSLPADLTKGDLAYNNNDISFISKVEPGGGGTTYYYEVTYDANTKDFKGEVPVDEEKYSSGSEVIVLDSGDLSREGYTFEGWNTKADGSGTSYKSEDIFSITEDTTLYAQWKKDDILDKENHNAYLIGYPDGTVQPDGNITRAEVSAIYFRLMTDEAREEFWKTSNNYTDVVKEAWYNNEVSTLSNAGVIKGYPEGDFKPDGDITRAEFASMTARFLGDKVKATNGKLNDIEGHWAKEDINKLVAEGIIEGYEDGSFKPEQSITRAEAAKIVNGILERTPHKDGLLEDMKVWPDNNEKAWYYVDIQEATNTHEYERKTNKDPEKWTKILPNKDWTEYEKELEKK